MLLYGLLIGLVFAVDDVLIGWLLMVVVVVVVVHIG